MTVRYFDGVNRSETQIRDCENTLGVRLTPDFRRFVAKQDGARPDTNSFAVGETNSCAINRFVPIANIAEQGALIENLSDTRLPIAWAEGGNYVCLETTAPGGIYFWDHEEPDLEHRLADSFEHFLDALQATEPAHVELDPATVKKAWIDPEFLNSIKKR